VSIRRRAFGDVADLTPVLDLIRALPTASRHVLDFGWRLTAPAIVAGRAAVYWQDADGRVIGLAAWQQAWATLDFYIRPGPGAVAVEMFRRFKARGASVAVVETEFDLTAARAAYEAAGFGQTHTIWRQDAWAADVT
jgi:hypothetical protein